MRALISIVVTLGIAGFMYLIYLRSAVPAGGTPQQVISTTGVEVQLLNLAQAERMYYVQNNSYASLDQLSSSGTFTVPMPDHDGYNYSVDASSTGFTATATHADVPGKTSADYPTLSIDQGMQVHRN